jgi:hypothetical protein
LLQVCKQVTDSNGSTLSASSQEFLLEVDMLAGWRELHAARLPTSLLDDAAGGS